MNEPTLVILAAGMGSRYGGLKQVDTVGNNGESIIDFSFYDAYKAGFRHLVLIIRREHEDLFEQQIAGKLRPFMDVQYAYQDIDDLPAGFHTPEGRTKPWGTVQALLSTRHVVNGPFMIINADDFYGRDPYITMYRFLKEEVTDNSFGMVGYELNKTLTDNGSVTRGICEADENGYLTGIVETQKIIRKDGHPYSVDPEGNETLIENGLASMNLWGMTPAVFPYFKQYFREFLSEQLEVPKSELVIPTTIGDMIHAGQIRVKVMATDAEWFGVTYPQDKQTVTKRILSLKTSGVYPFDLWRSEQ